MTTTTPTTTSVPRRPAPGLADGVPAPRVTEAGDDRVAIARSLVEYGRWLEWHDPDPALVDHAYAPDSALANSMTKAIVELRSRRERIQEVDRSPLEFEVVSALPNAVSFRLTEHLARLDLVSATGGLVDHVGARTERYIVIIMRFRADAPWRLLVVERRRLPVEVQL